MRRAFHMQAQQKDAAAKGVIWLSIVSSARGKQGYVDAAQATDIAGAKPYVKVALAEVMAGKPVTEASTKPYGCSVKY